MKGLGGSNETDGAAEGEDPAGGISAHLTPDEQAQHHRRTRLAKETEIVEDYVELIADLIEQSGEARSVEIARRLGVTNATVNKMVSRLAQMKLVTTQPYRAIFLTEEGRRIAELSRRRHQIIVAFLVAVGVPEDTARADAEGIEHYCSPETLEAFQNFVEKQR
jgi:DtxR family manganese transport transcriptional regulator